MAWFDFTNRLRDFLTRWRAETGRGRLVDRLDGILTQAKPLIRRERKAPKPRWLTKSKRVAGSRDLIEVYSDLRAAQTAVPSRRSRVDRTTRLRR